MFLEVVKANYLDGYKIQLLFNNGETKVVDVQTLRQSIYMILHHKIATLAITHQRWQSKDFHLFLCCFKNISYLCSIAC